MKIYITGVSLVFFVLSLILAAKGDELWQFAMIVSNIWAAAYVGKLED